MAVRGSFQQSRFHFRRHSSDAVISGGVDKEGCLRGECGVVEEGGLLQVKREGVSWKEQQQLRRALTASLQSSLKKQEARKTIKRKSRQTRSTDMNSQSSLASRKFVYPSSLISPTNTSLTDVPNVTKNIQFAEDFIDYLCLRPSGVHGWRVFHQLLGCNQQMKKETEPQDFYNIADFTQHPSDYFEKPLNTGINDDLDNDSADCMSEESLEPSDISSYFV